MPLPGRLKAFGAVPRASPAVWRTATAVPITHPAEQSRSTAVPSTPLAAGYVRRVHRTVPRGRPTSAAVPGVPATSAAVPRSARIGRRPARFPPFRCGSRRGNVHAGRWAGAGPAAVVLPAAGVWWALSGRCVVEGAGALLRPVRPPGAARACCRPSLRPRVGGRPGGCPDTAPSMNAASLPWPRRDRSVTAGTSPGRFRRPAGRTGGTGHGRTRRSWAVGQARVCGGLYGTRQTLDTPFAAGS